ncbi:MAG: hypothetical protein H8E33_01650 [Candidatus Cloacimonetes bacterium]|nr:hypothetical protein [Candidatus Cloacimonadota bacterium]MBL7107813.1 hypothetical protein [Candidatus Cloacimonadota bacterium]
MINEKMQEFIENNNSTYLYLILANEELKRLSKLPYLTRKKMEKKLTTLALEHVADNDIQDYFVPDEEEPEEKITDIIDE